MLWAALTIAGAVVGYALSLLAEKGGGADVTPSLLLLLSYGAALGAIMGVLMGVVQSFGGRGQIVPIHWVFANAIGWTPAMMVIMFAATSAQPNWSLGLIALVGAAAGACAGLSVGVATSLALPKDR